MPEVDRNILVLNSGSSSIKFALFAADAETKVRRASGSISGIGAQSAEISIQQIDAQTVRTRLGSVDFVSAVSTLLEHLQQEQFIAVGHRIVHGGPKHFEPEVVDASLLHDLCEIIAFAPEHLPQAIALIDAIAKRFPDVPQIACFDTAFHKDLPTGARTLPLPRHLQAIGVRRYGFHGLSYEYLLQELARIGRPNEAKGCVILAHLGNGASLAAVHGGKPIDTTMGMTPAGGLVMSTRTGDIDPGIVSFLARHEHLSPEQFHRMVNHASGLVGVSETTGDMRQLFAAEEKDPRAAEAIELFCYSARKWIGAFAAAMGGLETLVFSGGIGEHQAEVRRRICESLGFIGIELDAPRNNASAPIISREDRSVVVRVIPTDEESTILRSVMKLLSKQSSHTGTQS